MRLRHCVELLGVGLLAVAGVMTPATAIAADAIKVGFPIPMSGPTAVYGIPIMKGAEMAVAEINAKGGATYPFAVIADPQPMVMAAPATN